MTDRVLDDDVKYAMYVRWRAQQMFVSANAFIDSWKRGENVSFEGVAERLGLKDAEAARRMILFEHSKREQQDATLFAAMCDALGVFMHLSHRRLDEGDGGWFDGGAGI